MSNDYRQGYQAAMADIARALEADGVDGVSEWLVNNLDDPYHRTAPAATLVVVKPFAEATRAIAAARPAVERCAEHPAFDADYCPSCGTARPVGATVWADTDGGAR